MPHLSLRPPSAIFVLFNSPAFSSSWGHSTKKIGFKHRSRWCYRSAPPYGRASNVSSNVRQKAFPLSNVMHLVQTHLMGLLHQTSGRAALKSPAVAWPRWRCKKRELIPAMSSEHRWECVRGGSPSASQSTKSEMEINKKATLDLNSQICQVSLETYCPSHRQNTTRAWKQAGAQHWVPASLELVLDTSKNSKLPKVAQVWVLFEEVKKGCCVYRTRDGWRISACPLRMMCGRWLLLTQAKNTRTIRLESWPTTAHAGAAVACLYVKYQNWLLQYKKRCICSPVCSHCRLGSFQEMVAPPQCWSHYRCNLCPGRAAEKAAGGIKWCPAVLTECWCIFSASVCCKAVLRALVPCRSQAGTWTGSDWGAAGCHAGDQSCGSGRPCCSAPPRSGCRRRGRAACSSQPVRGEVCMWTAEGRTNQQH